MKQKVCLFECCGAPGGAWGVQAAGVMSSQICCVNKARSVTAR